MSSDLSQKLMHAGVNGAVFLAASLPQLYSATNQFVSENGSCPTYKTRLLHTVIFFALLMLAMKYVNKSADSAALLAKHAFHASMLFFVLSSPEAYRFTNALYPGLADLSGCPTMTGLVVHALLFTGAVYLIKHFPADLTV